MDECREDWHYLNMQTNSPPIPAYALYGESHGFPDLLHCERITTRAALHDWQIEPHRHGNLHQFFLLLRGKAVVGIDGESLTLTEPTLLSIPRWVVHGFLFERGTEGFVLSLPHETLPELFGPQTSLAPVIDQWGAVAAEPALSDLFEAILAEQTNSLLLRDTLMRALALQIVTLALRSLAPRHARSLPDPNTRHMAGFEALVRQHLRAQWRIETYAAELSISPTHLGRVVRSLTGISAARYIETRLFLEARRLLAYTRLQVAEVGYALGFEDPSYFSRAFRRHTGESPGLYRQRLQDPVQSAKAPATAAG
jgi:AraC family transcriptional regulator, transcriptional activator of pobA